MDYYNSRSKRASESGPSLSYGGLGYLSPRQSGPFNPKFSGQYNPPLSYISPTIHERSSCFVLNMPLYSIAWASVGDLEYVALSTFKEELTNRLQVVQGLGYNSGYTVDPSPNKLEIPTEGPDGFQFSKVGEFKTDYPITNLQWDPSFVLGHSNVPRVATLSEVFRIYQLQEDATDEEQNSINDGNDSSFINNGVSDGHHNHQNPGDISPGGFRSNDISNTPTNPSLLLVQTHVLANNASANGLIQADVTTFPPVTSFDWNKTDPLIVITSLVDTTCTIWDLSRQGRTSKYHTAAVKTQLIAHDSEVFDVKFIHDLTNIFALVGNDGLTRVFDLRLLEHSTIIFEPPPASNVVAAGSNSFAGSGSSRYNLNALLRLLTLNIDQYHLAAVGLLLNQVIILDMRVPGVPVARLDCLYDGMNSASINLIAWHPLLNILLTGGDDCQALVWDCINLPSTAPNGEGMALELPTAAYEAEMEVNNVCWRQNLGNWIGVAAGKGFQAVAL